MKEKLNKEDDKVKINIEISFDRFIHTKEEYEILVDRLMQAIDLELAMICGECDLPLSTFKKEIK